MGRRVLQVRVCSCPKRDKDKEEKEYQQQGNKDGALNGKKRKSEKLATNVDLQEQKFTLKVLGKQNHVKVVQYALDLMKSEAFSQGANPDPAFKRIINDLNNQLSKLSAFLLSF